MFVTYPPQTSLIMAERGFFYWKQNKTLTNKKYFFPLVLELLYLISLLLLNTVHNQ